MKSKKSVVQFPKGSIVYEENEATIEVRSFDPKTQSVMIQITKEGKKSTQDIAFAHLPKSIKQLVRPLK
jgi:hypothetical protein